MAETNLIDLVRALRRHKVLFFVVFGIILLLGAVYSVLVAKPTYSATATLSIESLLQFAPSNVSDTDVNLKNSFSFEGELNDSTAISYVEYLLNTTTPTVSTPEELQARYFSVSTLTNHLSAPGYLEALKENSALPDDIILSLERQDDAKTLKITLSSGTNKRVQNHLDAVCDAMETEIASSVSEALEEIRLYAQAGIEQGQQALEDYTEKIQSLLDQNQGKEISFSLYGQMRNTFEGYAQSLADQAAYQSLLTRCDTLESAGVTPRVQVQDSQQTVSSQVNRFAAYMMITLMAAVVISIIVTLAYSTLRRAYQEGR